jgi:hypothetical protein
MEDRGWRMAMALVQSFRDSAMLNRMIERADTFCKATQKAGSGSSILYLLSSILYLLSSIFYPQFLRGQ